MPEYTPNPITKEIPSGASQFLRSGVDPEVPYEGPSTDGEWDLFRRAARFGVARLADDDGLAPYYLEDGEGLGFVVHGARHYRAWWVWQEYRHARNETPEADEFAQVLDDALYLLRWMLELGDLEWVTREQDLFIRVCDLESALSDRVQMDGTNYVSGDDRVVRLAALRSMPYAEYLQSPEWAKRRLRHLEFAGFRCQLCNKAGQLHVHHRTYERRGFERTADLVVLCSGCHKTFHETSRLSR